MATETKGEFAARCNVSPGRVSQWITEGKIAPTSLEGDGRSARIIIDSALADLRGRLDVSQRTGMNGLSTKLNQSAASAEPGSQVVASRPARIDTGTAHTPAASGSEGGAGAASIQELPRFDATAELIAQEKLQQAQIETRRKQRDEQLSIGTLMKREEAEAQIARTAAMVLSTVESGFNDLADALAAEFNLPRHDLMHTMLKGFRKVRTAASRAFADKAAAIERAEAEALPAPDVEE